MNDNDLPKKIDFGKKVDIYNKRVDKLKNQYGLKDNDTLGKYHQSFWEEYIFNAGQQFGYRVPKTILKKLTKRWAFFDKSYKIPQIRKDLKSAINKVKKSKDPKVLNTLKVQLDRLNAIGGLKSVVPSEGITFVYKGKLFKYTGAFAPANQILGMLKFV